MKIVAFAGSNSDASINKKLITFAATFFEGHEVEILDLNDYEMPIYKVEDEVSNGVPVLAEQFAAKIDASDAVMMSLAEHNSVYTTAFKNVFDWISRIKNRKHFGEKSMFLMATAPGPGGGKNVVEIFQKRAPFSGADIKETFILPKFKETFDLENGIIDPEKKEEFEQKIQSFKTSIGI